MNKETLKERLYDYILEQNVRDVVQLHNNYCEAIGYSDDRIYENEEEFFEIHYYDRMMELVRALGGNKDYNFHDEYVKMDGYGNPESISDYMVIDEWIDLDEMINHIIDEDDDLESEEIREILNEAETEDDDDESED